MALTTKGAMHKEKWTLKREQKWCKLKYKEKTEYE